MAKCRVCDQEIQQGYQFCHTCGTPIGDTDRSSRGATEKSALVEWVDKYQDLQSRTKGFSNSIRDSLDQVLGDQNSIQRQICHALIAGFALTGVLLAGLSLLAWIEIWLFVSTLLLIPINRSVTGVFPFSSLVARALGPELSLRRRAILAVLIIPLIWTFAFPASLGTLKIKKLFDGFQSPPEQPLTQRQEKLFDGSQPSPEKALTQRQEELAEILAAMEVAGAVGLAFLCSYLIAFYFMGFSTTWIHLLNRDLSLSLNRLGDKAPRIAEKVREDLTERAIKGLVITKAEMSQLKHFTAGASTGNLGEQISCVSGNARIVLFIQDFGKDLFVRWVGFYDLSGRRLWLLIGMVVAWFNRLAIRWTGTSLIEYQQRVISILMPSTRNQILIDTETGGVITRALRLAEGVSLYSWNEYYALELAARESLIRVLATNAESEQEAERIRSRIDQLMSSEAGSSESGKSARRSRG